MKIVFHKEFYRSDYANDAAAAPGRIEAAMKDLLHDSDTVLVTPYAAEEADIIRCHSEQHIKNIKADKELYSMALLSAGAAIKAADLAVFGQPAFAVLRPPGHHAYRNMGWGYCHFANIAVALKRLRHQGLINSAFVLDFDAHTGDGTKDVLSDWKEVKILNPMSEKNNEYLEEIEEYLKNLNPVDIIAVSAGFDSYYKDVGRKLQTFDFYKIGWTLKNFSKKLGHNKRFAVLEGGYYQQDLGKNVHSFCQGFL